MTRAWLTTTFLCAFAAADAHGLPATAPTSVPTATTTPSISPIVWLSDLDAVFLQAQRARQPVLAIVYQGADSRSRALLDSIDASDDDALRKSLVKYARVRIDVEQDAVAAELLAVTRAPAMRILTPIGQTIASRDGAMTPAELARWLDANAAQAAGIVAPELLGDGEPNAAAVESLVKALGGSDAASRAAAIRRLTPYPRVAASKLVDQFASASLAVRLASLELLSAWRAPIEDLDPFKPETIDDAALARLRAWAAHVPATQPATQPSTLPTTGAQLESIEREIDQMLAALTDADAFAARERIARAGSAAVLPGALRRLHQPLDDRQRQRLVAMRYRLASTDRVALTWPGGLERLASPDTERRHEAIDELSKIVTADDAPLLLELFSDPDPFIRERSLRMLRDGGTDATSGLMKLLRDPEPNVRAAVLKQLAQNPDARAVAPVVDFVSIEKDADLIVHAVRVLRGTGGARAVECLISLLKNDNWRVRGEAAESLQEMIAAGGRGSYSSVATGAGSIAGKQSDVYAAMFGLLDDADGYVASRAVIALAQSRDPSGVKAAFEAVQHRPEVLGELTRTMQLDPSIVQVALPSLRKLTASTQPAARAAAITTLGTAVPDSCSDELMATLNDAESQVRVAAATALVTALARQRPRNGEVTESAYLGLSQKQVKIDEDKWLTEWRAGKRGPSGKSN